MVARLKSAERATTSAAEIVKRWELVAIMADLVDVRVRLAAQVLASLKMRLTISATQR